MQVRLGQPRSSRVFCPSTSAPPLKYRAFAASCSAFASPIPIIVVVLNQDACVEIRYRGTPKGEVVMKQRGWGGRFSRTAIEMGFPQKLKVVSWEQRLKAGRMALNWGSMIPHSSKSRSWSVVQALSNRIWRGSELTLVRLTPLRPRSFS